MKLALALSLLVVIATVAVFADAEKGRIVDIVCVVPNGYRGPIVVNHGKLTLPEIAERVKNTYIVVVVDDDGEAVEIGAADKGSGWEYRRTVVQRNGLRIKARELSDDEIGFRLIGGYGASRREYRPSGFSAYYLGTAREAAAFAQKLDGLVKVP